MTNRYPFPCWKHRNFKFRIVQIICKEIFQNFIFFSISMSSLKKTQKISLTYFQKAEAQLPSKKKASCLIKGGFPGGTRAKEPACQYRRHKRLRFNSQVRKIQSSQGRWRTSSWRAWQLTAVFWPGEPWRGTVHRVAKSGIQPK